MNPGADIKQVATNNGSRIYWPISGGKKPFHHEIVTI